MKILIAGYGSIGRRHLRNLRALGERDIVLYRTHRSTIPDEEIKDVRVETDLDAALAWKPDAAIISNPTALHMDVAIPAAKAGCSILIEKPVSDSMERIDELEDELMRAGGKVLVGFQFRFHPSLQQVKKWLLDGEVGRPVSARAHWGEYLPGWHPWEDYRQGYSARPELGGGVVLTLSHPFDYFRWFFGEAQSIWGMTGNLGGLGLEVEDTAELGLHFMDGTVASLHLDYLQRPATHRLEIIGTEGMIEWNNATGAARLFRAVTDGWESCLAPTGFERNDLFLAEMAHFLKVVQGQEMPLCSLNDGVQAMRLALAAREAGSSGQKINLAPNLLF